MPRPPALVLLNARSLDTARRVQALYPQARIYGLSGRVPGADQSYHNVGDTLRQLYRQDTPIIACCAAGILIRSLAPLLLDKGAEPPVLALAEDGSAVVPLLGGLGGVNRMAREIAAVLEVAPAITTSGELRFGTCLLNPPDDHVLADLEQGKRLVSDLLAGASVRIEGDAPWLDDVPLSRETTASRCIRISPECPVDNPHELRIHPRQLLLQVQQPGTPAQIRQLLERAGLAGPALAAVLADEHLRGQAWPEQLAAELNLPLRFLRPDDVLPAPCQQQDGLSLHHCPSPEAARQTGRPRGRLSVVGLGPGAASQRLPLVSQALAEAEDILGYVPYVAMAGPFRPEQQLHASDNREELQRAAHAFELAATGRRVVMVSSGDPGVFAMAAAVLEALETSGNPRWQRVALDILPGVSAAMATAARAGAPLGHDFCLISLSDNLKPWTVIEQRLEHAGLADLVMGFYNPVSRARPWQLAQALAIVARHRTPETQVVLGRDMGRPGERLLLTTLGELQVEQVDMRTLVIIGSSRTRRFHSAGRDWVYTPRHYSPD